MCPVLPHATTWLRQSVSTSSVVIIGLLWVNDVQVHYIRLCVIEELTAAEHNQLKVVSFVFSTLRYKLREDPHSQLSGICFCTEQIKLRLRNCLVLVRATMCRYITSVKMRSMRKLTSAGHNLKLSDAYVYLQPLALAATDP